MFCSLDIETTGLNRFTCDVLEVAVVIDDCVNPLNDQPMFREIVAASHISGSPFAIHMNAALISDIADGKGLSLDLVAENFAMWMSKHWPKGDPVLFVGKNSASFDLPFLAEHGFFGEDFKQHHRGLDPGSMYYKPGDGSRPPSIELCCRRAGIAMIPIYQHTALYDAVLVCALIRQRYGIAHDFDFEIIANRHLKERA